jgi:8-oxo-dGTP diphosphatase
VADLEAALRLRDPKRLPKHPAMLAAAGVAVEDSRLLLLRDPQGFWSGVGGFLEPGESPEQALLREVREELGVEAEITRVFRPALLWRVDSESSFLLFLYGIRLASHEFSPDPKEVSAVRWCDGTSGPISICCPGPARSSSGTPPSG